MTYQCPTYLKKVEGEKNNSREFKSKEAYIVWDVLEEDSTSRTSEEEESDKICVMVNTQQSSTSINIDKQKASIKNPKSPTLKNLKLQKSYSWLPLQEQRNNAQIISKEEIEQRKQQGFHETVKNRDILSVGYHKLEDRLPHYFLSYVILPKFSNHSQISDIEIQLIPLPYAIFITKILEHFGVSTTGETKVALILRESKIDVEVVHKMGFSIDPIDHCNPLISPLLSFVKLSRPGRCWRILTWAREPRLSEKSRFSPRIFPESLAWARFGSPGRGRVIGG
ncbi:hypothetical protein Lal_00042373 [Lupinus albus]|nr:hypothetical protein Lal_00042373 [Lupinus albus]